MPRYFFHLFNSLDSRDEEGRHLPDLDSARSHAINEARQLMSADVKDRGEIDLNHRIDVGGEAGEILAVVKFDDAVTIIACSGN